VWPFFCWYAGKSFIHGCLGRTGALYAPRNERCGNSIRTALKCGLREGVKKGKKVDFREVGLQVGLQSGVTKWGYIFGKVGLQNSCQAPPSREVASEQKRGG
jgi:hypothetical protein